jgi:hypothetical protein
MSIVLAAEACVAGSLLMSVLFIVISMVGITSE